ncbi:hypothetical protein AUEXF2481DRAFT_284091 [Aureobasidium subglaciale EXF-2481]|uniref:Uncharacterized protein n=1 Tax=Aureobasidium subglaciale (strain EXF-2481) TaxID=1043005 RepID=A0A074Y8A9_AURSE|nr:uncharacterized protein AUEXF2481DRAFT_284091 [Aureobasidium subglaciale EXF-2481]KEQ93965.1 hypothetical protein AUEXF2481DRAFT_284091 [Aureobasidium subglaciale EXF-2481]
MSTPRLLLLPNTLVQLFEVSPRLGQLSTVDHSRSNLTTSAHTFCPAIFSCETCYPLRNGYAGTDLASVIMSKTSLQTLPW